MNWVAFWKGFFKWLGAFLSACGLIGVLVLAGWKMALAILILVMGNNMEQWRRRE